MSGGERETGYEAELRQRQFATLLKLSPQALVVLDADGRIREWNPATEGLLGWPRADVLGRQLYDLAPAVHASELKELWEELRTSRQAGAARNSHLHRDRALTVEVYMAPIMDVDGSFAGVVATFSDESGPAHSTSGASPEAVATVPEPRGQRARSAALTALELDEVTGLPGRRWLQQRLTRPLPVGEERAVAVIDVDAFELVNQGYGPEAGDAVLKELAGRLARTSGAATVGHWQADEFVCILDGREAEAALTTLVAEMAEIAREPIALGGDVLRLTLSAGLAATPAVPLPSLFRSSSAAMAAAKARGRDRTVWFDARTTPEIGGSGLRMANDLHRGLLEGQLRLHFQPIIELATNDVDGVEALVRWQRPGVGLLAPDAFIEIAERTGQIVALGEWVVDEACRAAVSFEAVRLSPVRVSINVSARQLSDPGLDTMLAAALARHGCPPERLAIEVTETAVLHDIAAATAVLETIKGLGIELDLDDFGTGYSSLLYLRYFPVDRIKIDRSFVSGLGTNVADTAIVSSTIALAHSVGLRAIAEGVETIQQLTLLRQMGCDFAQGYLLCRPIPADELVPWMQQQPHSRLLARHGSASGNGDPDIRDSVADQRDDLADERDEIANQRDLVADQREAQADRREDNAAADGGAGLQAELDRGQALADRGAVADERILASSDRSQAQADRRASAQDRQRSSVDALTGAYLRDTGRALLFAEMATAARNAEPFTLAYVAVTRPVDGPADDGQMGSDALMVIVANALGGHLGDTDLLVRDGSEHFVCSLRGLTKEAAVQRLDLVKAELGGPRPLVDVSVGCAEAGPLESADGLIERGLNGPDVPAEHRAPGHRRPGFRSHRHWL